MSVDDRKTTSLTLKKVLSHFMQENQTTMENVRLFLDFIFICSIRDTHTEKKTHVSISNHRKIQHTTVKNLLLPSKIDLSIILSVLMGREVMDDLFDTKHNKSHTNRRRPQLQQRVCVVYDENRELLIKA